MIADALCETHNVLFSTHCAPGELPPSRRRRDVPALIVNDGFSCREQIEQLTPRRAMHLAQVIKMAYDRPPREPYPERRYVPDPREAERRATRHALIGAATLAAGGAALWATTRKP